MRAYAEALDGAPRVVIGERRSPPGSTARAVALYLGSSTFAALAPSTQASRRALLERFRAEHGDKRFHRMGREHVARLAGRLRPHAARNMLKALRALAAFALAEGLIDADPTEGVKLARPKDRGGHRPWDTEHVEQYRSRHPQGTRARLALELLLGTCLRRGDAVRIGRQHIRDGVISIRQSKTGMQVDIPVLPELQAAIDAMSRADNLTFVVTEIGKPFTAHGFSGWFRKQCDLAGLPPNLSAHGLRKTGAVRLAEAGATEAELMAWGGWSTSSEVRRYTQAASRKRMARTAADKLKARTELANLGERLANQENKP